MAVVVAVVTCSPPEDGGGSMGSGSDEGCDEGADDTLPELPASVVIVRNSLLLQPVWPSDVCTFAHSALELSSTVSFVPCGMVRSAV